MSKRVIVSGGGTGGHIFPAIAIANAVKERWPDAEILFVGANGRMEMKRVPEAGYPIKGIDIYGLRRDLSFKSIVENLKLPFRLQHPFSAPSSEISAVCSAQIRPSPHMLHENLL